MVPQAFDSVTPEMWEAFCRHSEKEERQFWEKDGLQEEAVERFIIEVGKTDSEVEDGEGENATEDSDDETEDELDEQDKELKKRNLVTELDVT